MVEIPCGNLCGALTCLLVRGSFKLRTKPKKERNKTMVNFDNLLIGGAVMALVSFLITLFLVYHAKKQLKSKE